MIQLNSNKTDIKSTLRVDHTELLSFLSERPTIVVPPSEINDLLYQDVMAAVGEGDCDTIEVEV
jgi:hypothetical protein